MRLPSSTFILLGCSSLVQVTVALPFFHLRAAPAVELVRRATYSVVPVDGGPVQTQAPEATVVQTVVYTPTPRTTTILSTESVILPPVTENILTTRTVDSPKQTQTVVVELTPTPEIVATATSYSIIDVAAPSTTTKVVVSSRVSASSSSSSPQSTPRPSTSTRGESTSSTSALTSTTTLSTTTSSSTLLSASTTGSTSTASLFSTPSLTLSLSSASITPTPTTTTKTYDDGMWKTTYPPWNDTRTAGMWIRAPRVTPASQPVNLRSTGLEGLTEALTERASRSVFARFLAILKI